MISKWLRLFYVEKGLKKALFLCAACVVVLIATGCVGAPPVMERAKAVEAQRYAKKNYALKYAAPYYRKGSVYLKKAHEFYDERVYSKAQKAYNIARLYFEKAELKARVSQIKRGGEF